MTLENLAKIGSIKAHEPSQSELVRLLDAARRNLRDARVPELSSPARFDLAYKTVMQCGLLALMANGFRPSTNAPGHHAIVIQTLPRTLGYPKERLAILDQLRRKRHLADYAGVVVSEEEAAACERCATELLAILEEWLQRWRPRPGRGP